MQLCHFGREEEKSERGNEEDCPSRKEKEVDNQGYWPLGIERKIEQSKGRVAGKGTMMG